ncbi:MAG: chemotaxis protein CheR [Desulfobacteraceae bacterium 4572_88]|nr:MAG: chemotaxis protein CheR [Desulfobacteraceae bacterium 4572_88]
MKENEIEKIEVDLFVEAIFQRYGYDFKHYAKASVRRRTRNLLQKTGYSRISEMIPKLLYDESFFQSLVCDFSITVTEMFRDPDFFMGLRKKVIPYLKTYPFVKIWHAGCATGEEVYSLAIVLKEEGLYDRATIFATDFNDTALKKAKDGIYPIENIRHYTANYQKAGSTESFSKYYHAEYESAIMDQALKERITFANHNLATDGVFGEMHLILCRNVLIYFDKTLQNRVFDLFSNSLIHKGFLCIGSKESLQFSEVCEHFSVADEKQKIYQKKY